MLGRSVNRRIRQHVRRADVEVIVLWHCKYCGHKNDETLTVCDKCGALKDDDIGDSGDNQDSEDLFFDDEGI